MATNARRRGNEARARTPAPLRGLMRCTHLQRGDDATAYAPARSALPLLHLPRRQPQGPRHLPSLLHRRQRGRGSRARAGPAAARIDGSGRAAHHRGAGENGAAEDAVLADHDAIEALGALEPVWDELYPAEHARILRLLIERIDVAPDGVSVTLHAAGIRSLVAELAGEQAAAPEPGHGSILEAAE